MQSLKATDASKPPTMSSKTPSSLEPLKPTSAAGASRSSARKPLLTQA